MIRNKICGGSDCLNAALSSGVTSLQLTVASAKSVSWGSFESESLLYLVLWPSSLTFTVKTQHSEHCGSHHWPESPLT